ncbi:MAG: hypothetical protein IJU92_09330 [Spirochaetaceae bacterium]|nr:hypothetical protein [Spirochaetaceae bacterium]
MLAVKGYYDGSRYVMEQEVSVKPNQKVIITFLDDFEQESKKKSLSEIRSYMKGGKSVPESISTVDYVRSLRAD